MMIYRQSISCLHSIIFNKFATLITSSPKGVTVLFLEVGRAVNDRRCHFSFNYAAASFLRALLVRINQCCQYLFFTLDLRCFSLSAFLFTKIFQVRNNLMRSTTRQCWKRTMLICHRLVISAFLLNCCIAKVIT